MRISIRLFLLSSFLVQLNSGCGGSVSGGSPAPPPTPIQSATVTVDTATVIVAPFSGYGVQWDPYSYQPSAADWQTTLNRLSYMKPGFFRVMSMATDYCLGFDNSGNPIYVWQQGNAVVQQHLGYVFKLLDFAQANNIPVILGEWDWPTGLATPGQSPIAGPDDPRWARIVADYVSYLINTKGYTVIRYYNYMNEPNGSWMWPGGQTPSRIKWEQGIANLSADFATHNLSSVSIIGPDNAWDWNWLNQAAADIPDLIGMWDMHWYTTDAEVTGGAVERLLTTDTAMLLATDPHAAAKPRILGEMGMVDGKTAQDQQPRVVLFEYGVLMADVAAQVARSGWTGASAWDLDDAMHTTGNTLKLWGMWNSHSITGDAYDMTPRPWFYPWSLLCRLFPRSATIVKTSGDSHLGSFRSTATTWTSTAGSQATVLLVNDGDTATTIMLKAPALGTRTLLEYNYFSGDAPVDGNLYPTPEKTITNADLSSGIQVKLPSRGVVFLTTLIDTH